MTAYTLVFAVTLKLSKNFNVYFSFVVIINAERCERMTDNEILESIYVDNVAGFTLLVDTYADLVYKIVYEILSPVGTQEDIQDCVSDTFVAFFYNIDDVDLSKGTINGYLGVIARRRAVNLRYTLSPDDDTAFDEYTVEEMSQALENEEVLKSAGLSDIIIRQCLKEIVAEVSEDEFAEEFADEIAQEPENEITEESDDEPVLEIVKKKRRGFGRVLKTLIAIVSIVSVIGTAVIVLDKFSVPKYVPPTTQPTTQEDATNPLFSAILSGNEKLIENLITSSLLLSQDVLKFAVEHADKISYDIIRRIAEEVRDKYGSTGLDSMVEGAIFGDFQAVEDKLKNKDESEMTPAEKLALFIITTFESQTG